MELLMTRYGPVAETFGPSIRVQQTQGLCLNGSGALVVSLLL